MKLLSHLNPADVDQLRVVDDNFSFQFLEGYTRFYRDYYGQQMHLLYSPEFDAYLPLRIIKTKIARLGQIFHAPFQPYTELVPKDQLIFFNMMLRFIREENLVDRLIQPHPFSVLSALPPNVRFCEFGTYVIDLQGQTMDRIFHHFNPKYQKAIRHAIKHRARVVSSWDAFGDFYSVYRQTMERVGLSSEPKSFFLTLKESLGAEHTVPAVVYDQELPAGCAFFVYTKYAAYCTHAGSTDGSKLYGAMKLLHYDLIRFMQERGVCRYDLVGVRLRNTDPALEGVFRFKKGFGGDLRSGYLWKTDIHPLKTRVYDFFMTLRPGIKPKMDIIDQSN